MARSVKFGLTVLAFAAANCVGLAHATLIGDSVSCEGRASFLTCAAPGTTVYTSNAVVSDSASEFDLLNRDDRAIWNVDISDSRIVVSNLISGAVQDAFGFQWTFGDLDWVGESGRIVGLDVTAAGNIDPFNDSNLSFTDDSITYTAEATRWAAGAALTIDLLVEHGPAPDLPEPGTLGLLGIAGCFAGSCCRFARRAPKSRR